MNRLHLCVLFLLPLGTRTSTDAQQAAAPAPAKWDVTDDLGPTTHLAFDTSEGTWMNVDVSPDGRRIVFDLLGDLYTMPIGGAAAPRRADYERPGLRHAAAIQP